MKFVYLLVQVYCSTFISGIDDKNLGATSVENHYIFWEVYFPIEPKSGKSHTRRVHKEPKSGKSLIRKVPLHQDLFKKETAAFIIEHRREQTEETDYIPPRRTLYYWFGKNVSLDLRTETVRHVAKWMERLVPNIPALIPIHRCVSGLEPNDFQMITHRQYRPVKKLYKVKGSINIMITPVLVTFRELTKMDPFVLITYNYVIIFVPLQANAIKKMKALQFGLYLKDIVYKNKKTLLYVDCHSNFQKQEWNFNIFLNEIDPEYLSDEHLIVELYSLCNVETKSNVDALIIHQSDVEFEKKRKNTVQILLHYYECNENIMKYHYYEKGTRWEDIIDEAVSHTLYVTGGENDDRFIFLGNASVYEEINTILQYGEKQSEKWQNLKIVQNHLDLPVDFIILFPDCWKRFPDVNYVNQRFNLVN